MAPMPAGQSNAPSDRDFAEWNEAMVERYDIDRYYAESNSLVRWIERKRLSALARLADVQPRDHLLEVGCGGGHVLQQFPQARRTGIDLSTNMLRRARLRLNGSAHLLRGSADRLPFADGAFQVVLCTEVLEHVPDPSAVLRELIRVAAPGGRVVVSIPNERNIDRAKRMLRRTPVLARVLRTLADEGNEWHLHQFDWAMLERNLQGVARVAARIAIPSVLVPIRYVASLESART
ncbi:MAG: class I SAM-dependent methyltransferase [Longimicrobiales bacterium]